MTYEQFAEMWDGNSDSIECTTSGSTGTPKSIFLPKHEMRRSARRTIDFFGVGRDSLLYSCISPDYIGGKMQFVRCREAGCRFAYEKPSNTPLAGYSGGRIDMVSVVPSQMLYIAGLRNLPDVGAYLVGGGPVHDKLRKIIAARGIRAYETYGMTETASHIAIRRISDPEETFSILPGISISTSGDGCLTIDIEGWQSIVTNDIVRMDTPETFTIRGRADNVIVSGGLKVHPEEVEAKVRSLTGMECMVSSESDEKWGERVVLTLEPDGKTGMEPGEIINKTVKLLRGHVAPHEFPKIIHIGTLPRTANGKLQRQL